MTNKKKKTTKKTNQRRQTPRLKTLLILGAALLLFIIIYSTSTLIYRTGKTKTIIQFAPNSATISLNGTKVANGSTTWLSPGNYHLSVNFNDHFENYEADIEITNQPAEYYGTLNALDDEGREYIEKHNQEYIKVEGMAGILLNRQGKQSKEDHPILNYLPINTSLYSISYQYDDNNKLVINVKSDQKYLDTAVAKMKLFENVELEDQNIVFLNNSPFENYQQNPIADIQKFIRAAYQLPNNYIINEPKEIDNYTYTTIYISDSNNDVNYAHYRVIMKKDNNEWKVLSTPQPLLTTFNTPNVDKKILKTINSY